MRRSAYEIVAESAAQAIMQQVLPLEAERDSWSTGTSGSAGAGTCAASAAVLAGREEVRVAKASIAQGMSVQVRACGWIASARGRTTVEKLGFRCWLLRPHPRAIFVRSSGAPRAPVRGPPEQKVGPRAWQSLIVGGRTIGAGQGRAGALGEAAACPRTEEEEHKRLRECFVRDLTSLGRRQSRSVLPASAWYRSNVHGATRRASKLDHALFGV